MTKYMAEQLTNPNYKDKKALHLNQLNAQNTNKWASMKNNYIHIINNYFSLLTIAIYYKLYLKQYDARP